MSHQAQDANAFSTKGFSVSSMDKTEGIGAPARKPAAEEAASNVGASPYGGISGATGGSKADDSGVRQDSSAAKGGANGETASDDDKGGNVGGGRDGGAQEEKEAAMDNIVVEQPLLTIKEVFVYIVPPLRASSGHRAEEWGLANPVFTGVLKMAQVGDSCCLRLFKPPPDGELGATPEFFAECEVRLDKGRTLRVFVESVIDSSRYFVLRCEDKASGRHAYVGIGFRERSSAFDFKAALDDFVRFMDRQKRAEEAAAVEHEAGEDADTGPIKQVKDLSIAEGQKVHLGLKGVTNGSSRTRRRPKSGGSTGDTGGLLLPPPPLPGATYKATGAPALTSPSKPAGPDDRRDADAARQESEKSPTSAAAGCTGAADAGVLTREPRVRKEAAVPETAERPEEVDRREEASGGESVDGDEDDGWGDFESA